jgi:hypothetical protein
MFIKSELVFKSRADINNLSEEIHFEICGIEITKFNTVYCCIYRSPSSSIDTFYEKLDDLFYYLKMMTK